MSNEKYCGNCKHFKDEDVEGWGWCSFNDTKTHCAQSWDCHNSTFNGWTKITSDNKDEVDCIPKDKVVIGWICNEEFRSCSLSCFWFTIKSIAQQGGFYYYVLPKLNINGTE